MSSNPVSTKKRAKNKQEELSPRWALFLDLYLENGNAYQAALKAGFSEEYSKVITTRYPEKVSKSLKEALDDKGITTSKIAEKISVLLEAKSGEEPNYQAIDKGISHAMKARGDIVEDNPKGNTYNFLFSAETQADIKQIEDKIKAKLIGNVIQTNPESVEAK